MNYIRNTSTQRAEESLVLPSNATLELYKLDAWNFSPLIDLPGGIYKLYAECKISGFENLKYEWTFEDVDLKRFGAGSQDDLRQYVMGSFENTLMVLKEDYLNRIKNAMGNVFSGNQ